ncbi:MAG: PAS domain S-box protein [Anaerolineae bacterium]|nr:PAS domain S-box protein [Anaerolineae bacterium]
MPLYGQDNAHPRRAGSQAQEQWTIHSRQMFESAIETLVRRQPRAMRYGVAVALALLALGLTHLFEPYVETTRFVFFSGAVVLASLNGGFGPGVVATILSVVFLDYFLTEPLYTLFAGPTAIIQTVMFVLVVGLISALQEARIRAQERLARTTTQLNVILQNVGAGITAQRAPDHRIMFVNETAAQLSGFSSPDEMLNLRAEQIRDLFELYDERGQLIDLSQMPGRRAVSERTGAGNVTYRSRRKDTGLERWIHLRSVPIYDEKGDPALVVSIMHDITDQKRLEAVHRQEEQRLRTVLDNLGILVGLLTPDGILIEANRTALQVANLKPEDVIGKPFEETYWWSYSEAVQAQLRDAIERARKGEMVAYDVKVRTGEDKWMIIAFQLAPIYEDGHIRYLLPSAVDITQRVQYEQELREVNGMLHWHQQRLVRIVNNIPGIIWESVTEPAQERPRLTFVSDQIEKFLGYKAGEFHANPELWQKVIHPADIHEARESVQAALERNRTASAEFRMISKDGRVFPVETHTTQVPAEDGQTTYSVGVIMDITSRKAAEERAAEYAAELKRSNEELHQFAYVASHDLQEPLRMVSSYLQLLEKHYGDKLEGDAKEYIEFAIDGAVRMKALIMDLLTYSRVESQTRNMTWAQSQRALEQALTNLKITIDERKAAVTADTLPPVWGDELQLTQLFQNLVGNAIKFASDKPPEVHVGVERRGDEWLFSVKDNGIGIEAQYQERIFAIFQRLHSKGKYPGTGIGLAICRKIVERHGGRIWVESTPKQGSTFFFTIPADSRKGSYVQRSTN